jgi:ubiquinone/menaquinone biosynthesis C-methylase UbiE
MTRVPILDMARWYDPLFDGVLGNLRDMATRIAPSKRGLKILDVGCGTGKQLVSYQNMGGELFGIDLSPQMLRVAKSNLNWEGGLINGDALQLPYPNSTFDLVISSLVLHQLIPEWRLIAFDETVRVLKPEGQILMIDFHPAASRSIIGNLTYFAISIVEFFAGWEHFRNSRYFLSQGGIPNLTDSRGLALRKTVVLVNGNLGIYLS